jgi:hypothetical protein
MRSPRKGRDTLRSVQERHFNAQLTQIIELANRLGQRPLSKKPANRAIIVMSRVTLRHREARTHVLMIAIARRLANTSAATIFMPIMVMKQSTHDAARQIDGQQPQRCPAVKASREHIAKRSQKEGPTKTLIYPQRRRGVNGAVWHVAVWHVVRQPEITILQKTLTRKILAAMGALLW